MITYNNAEYTTSESLREAINSDLAAIAYPYAVKHKIYGEGQLTLVKAPLIGGSLYATIDFAAGTKIISMDVVLAAGLLEMPEILLNTILEAQTAFKEDFIERERAEMRARIKEFEEAREAKKQAEKEKRREEKRKPAKAEVKEDAGNAESEDPDANLE